MKRFLILILLVSVFFLMFSNNGYADINWVREYEATVDGSIWENAYSGGKGSNEPTFVDIDNDGDLDMFIGKENAISYYRNDGTSDIPSWTFVTSSYNAIAGGGKASLTFVDIDGDGDFDMFIGDFSGTINYYRNDGTAVTPSWTLITENYNSIDVGGHSSPTFVDIDNDNDFDLFIGEHDGNLNYYRNDGTINTPSWTLVTENYESIDVGWVSSPTFCDIDGDGDYDMFLGGWLGYINYYRNNGDVNTASWTFVTENYNSIDVGDDSSPTFVDIDNDNDFDLFIGDFSGTINYYRNDGTAFASSWILATTNYEPTIDIGIRSKNTFIDIDNDNDFDMFIGERDGNINYYRNDGTAAAPSWTFVTSFYNSIDVGDNSAPAFVDIDGDNDFDMFIGERWGEIYYYRNDGTAANPSWTFITFFYNLIDVGSYSSPTFVDIDNDNDYDMFIGERWGEIYYYRNDGTANIPSWTFVTSTYESIDVGNYSAPTFLDIDNDGDFDMFIGESSGTINYYRNDGTAAIPSWTFVTSFYNSIDVGANSSLTFADIDNDNDYDMFIGNGLGGLSHWKANGFTSYPTLDWTGETNYTTDGLNPEIGSGSNTFVYRISYTSSEDNAPNTGFPKVHLLKGGIEISGSPFTMNEVNPGDLIYSDRKLYTYSKSGLSLGTDYTYYFEAYDLHGAPASGDPISPVDAPDVLFVFTISGTITDGVNPLPDVTVNLTGDSTEMTITDGGGNYSFYILNPGSTYIVTPTKIHYTFNPVDRTYIDLNADITDADFTASLNQWSISGTITNGVNPLPGVTVNLTGDSTASTITDGSGDYSFNNLDAGSTYIVTPTKINYTFTPSEKTYIDLSADVTDADFTSTLNQWSISGTITDSGNPMSGVMVTLSGDAAGEVKTGNDGTYLFTNLNAGSTYIITPKKKNYKFIPETYTVINIMGNIIQDFIGVSLFADDLNNVKVYPNPYKPGMGADGIIFDNLTENAKIRIYTIEGKLVITILPDSFKYQWDAKNESGSKLSSGVYLYIISNDKGEKKTGKLAVIK